VWRRQRILLNAATVVSLTTLVFFVGWWLWGPPPAWRPAGVFVINAKERRYLDEHPSEGPLEGYYSLPVGGGVEFTFGAVVFVSLLVPGFRVAVWSQRATSARWERLYQSRRGLCPACGYDLRATPERCPECGRIVIAAGGSDAWGEAFRQD
jgi:hypothetical protein